MWGHENELQTDGRKNGNQLRLAQRGHRVAQNVGGRVLAARRCRELPAHHPSVGEARGARMTSPQSVEMAGVVERILRLFPEVLWDRWTGELGSDIGVGVFGWIERAPQRDFVFLRIDKDGAWLVATSSAKYSASFAERLNLASGHTPCKLVKNFFNVGVPKSRCPLCGEGFDWIESKPKVRSENSTPNISPSLREPKVIKCPNCEREFYARTGEEVKY